MSWLADALFGISSREIRGTEGARGPRMRPRRLPFNSRKLLVATLGVAAVSYVGCTLSQSPSSGNLMSLDPDASGQYPTSGNLMAFDASPADSGEAGLPFPAADAGDAGDAGDATDATDAADAADGADHL
jgi:hypothetical protein